MTVPPPQRPPGPPRPPNRIPPRPPGMIPPRPPGVPPRPPGIPARPAGLPPQPPGRSVPTPPSGVPHPIPGIPTGRPPGVPAKPGAGQFSANRYAPKLQKGAPKPKQKMLGNLIFRSVFFIAFALTAYVLGPNYKINGALISFSLIGLMLVGVVMIDLVLWKCGICGTYLGILPWPGQRCKKCQVRFF